MQFKFERRFQSGSERKALDKSYCILIDEKNEYSVHRKLTAVELLAKFVKFPEHRERLEILYKKEKNKQVKEHIKKALDGTIFEYMEGIFESINKLDEDIESEYISAISSNDKAVINTNLPFYRYQARFNN